MDKDKLWRKIAEYIKAQTSTGVFRTWYTNVGIHDISEEKINIYVPSAFIHENIKSRYLPLLESAIEKEVGHKLIVEFSVHSVSNTKKRPEEEEEEKEENGEDFFQPERPVQTPTINSKYTLQNFVVGLTNNVAYAAAGAVAQNPGSSYNPLFIYGGTGVGKTHLMLGIGNTILAKNPYCKIIYCSSEKFTNDYIEAIQTRKMGELRTKYRSADLLLVDDVQFFSGREQTQEEFFHTFNELTAKNSQIVLTSDRPPGDMPKLEDRLKSRFQGGLMVDIQMPDFDTRVAILKAKCQEKGEFVPDESLNLIAASMETNTRELEGKLIQVIQILKIQNLPPSPDNIRTFLGQPRTDTPLKANYKQVITAVCTYFNIKQADLTGPKRKKDLVLPRHLTMYLLSEDLKLTVEKVGEVLGGRDHTTVMHGRDRIKQLIDNDKEVQRLFHDLKQSLSTI